MPRTGKPNARNRQTKVRRRHRWLEGTSSDALTPLSVSGIEVWADYADASTLYTDTTRTTLVSADAQQIKGVTDKSGAGNHLSSTVGMAYKVGIRAGRSVARFDGTDDSIKLTSALLADTAYTIMLVAVKRSAPGATKQALISIPTTNAYANLVTDSDTHATSYMWFYDNAGVGDIALTGTATNWSVLTLKVNSAASIDFYADGGTATNFDPYAEVTTATRSLWQGTLAGGSGNPGDYDIGEVLMYDAALTSAQINTLGSYLAAKWGTTWTTVA